MFYGTVVGFGGCGTLSQLTLTLAARERKADWCVDSPLPSMTFFESWKEEKSIVYFVKYNRKDHRSLFWQRYIVLYINTTYGP